MAGVRVSPAWGRPLAFALLVAVGVGAGCGGEDRHPDGPAAAEPAGPAASPASPGGYELDVIAEAEPDEGPPPLTVQFRGYVEEDEGGPWRFAWDFGDGSGSTEQNPTHVYEREGDFTAVLTATDQRGNTGTDEIDVFVERDD